MEKSPMPKWLKVTIAIAACAIVLVGYSVLSVSLGFEHGGGYFILILLFSLLGGLWRAIVGSDKNKETDVVSDTNPIEHEDATDSEPSDIKMENQSATIAIDGSEHKDKILSSPISANIGDSPKYDFHIVVKVLLLILMVIGIVVMVYQGANDFTWENYTVGWIRLIGSLIGLSGFILLYLKKFSGFIVIVSVLLFSVIYSAIMHDANLGMIIFAAVFRVVAISLILLIRHNGVSAWSILLHRHSETLHELKETFPVKPFLYIDKTPVDKPTESPKPTMSFKDWLNK